MKRHHFKVTVLPATIVDVCCLNTDYTGPDTEGLDPREVDLGPTVLNRTAYEIEVTLSDPSDLAEKVDDVRDWSALDPCSLASFFAFEAADEFEESEPM
jgi:hypothetical protein